MYLRSLSVQGFGLVSRLLCCFCDFTYNFRTLLTKPLEPQSQFDELWLQP